MRKIYSKVNPDKLISSVVSIEDIGSYRTDISPESEFLQVSARSLNDKVLINQYL